MSFKQNDKIINISLANYEEYFVLYMDGELTADGMKAVEAFIAAHPHLQGELDGLMDTRLPAEELSFDKTSLFAQSMKVNAADEELLLYIDNELPAGKAEAVQQKLATDTDFYNEHQLLVKTKLDAAERISYPDKEELYHKEVRRLPLGMWMRAAVVTGIAALGILYWTSKPDDDVVTGSHDVAYSVPVVTAPVPKTITAPDTQAAIEQPQQPTDSRPVEPVQEDFVPAEKQSFGKAANQHLRLEDKTVVKAPAKQKASSIPVDDKGEIAVVKATGAKNSFQQIVTSEAASAYNSIDETIDPEPEIDNNKTKKGSFKGFLRKATRMIERRTGIAAADDNDQLLIGALAINLK